MFLLLQHLFQSKKSDFGKKAAEFGGEMSKQAQKAAENISKQTQEFSKTTAYKKVSEVNRITFIYNEVNFNFNFK